MEPSSFKTYCRIWLAFQAFVIFILNKSMTLPVTSQIVIWYITYLHLSNYSLSSVRSHLAVISFVHKVRSLIDPCNNFIVAKMIKGYEKLHPKRAPKQIVDNKLMYKLMCIKHMTGWTNADFIIFRAILSLLYHGCMRVGELLVTGRANHHAKFANVYWIKCRGILSAVKVTLLSYKFSRGRPVSIIIPKSRNIAVCPVHHLKSYLRDLNKTPIELFVHKNGSPVTSSWFLQKLRQAIECIGMKPKSFGTHSIRAGYCTDIAARNFSYNQLNLAGRWHSGAVKSYFRPEVIRMHKC